MKGIFINMILDPFEAIQADSFWYIIAFENFKRYFLRLLIHRQLHNFSGRRSWVLTLISMHPDVPMSLRLWVVTLWKPRTDLVVSHSLHLGFSCCLSKTAVCLYCGNLCSVSCSSVPCVFYNVCRLFCTSFTVCITDLMVTSMTFYIKSYLIQSIWLFFYYRNLQLNRSIEELP